MFANVVCGHVGVELSDRREGDIAHGGVSELCSENATAGCACGIVLAGDELCEYFAAETGDVGGLVTAVGAGDDLSAHHIEGTNGNAAPIAHGVVTRVLVQKAGQKPGADISAVS